LQWTIKQDENMGFPGPSVSLTRKWTSTGKGPEVFADNQAYYLRKQYYRELRDMRQRLTYLKRHYYLERVREGNKMFDRLTSKGRYELLRLQFILHMRDQARQPSGKAFYLIVFDIPEGQKKFRDVFRNLLKRNGFRMLQRSVWITLRNPHPAIDQLLKCLKLERWFEIMEIDCQRCSPRLRSKMKTGSGGGPH